MLNTSSRSSLVSTARTYLGAPYAYGGSDAKRGFDCSGFTWRVFDQHNIELHRTSSDQYKQGKKISTAEAKPGDLIFFTKNGRIFHVGIVSKISSGKLYMIHASTSKGVIEQSIQNSYYWEDKVAGVRRLE